MNINLDRKVIPGNFLQMELDLPEIVEYLASGALLPAGRRNGKPEFEKDQCRKIQIQRDGKKYTRCILTFAPDFTSKLNKTQAWENYNRIYLKAVSEAGISGTFFHCKRASGITASGEILQPFSALHFKSVEHEHAS